ncbi:MAG: hypothetical protein WAL68_07940 [Candidatus Binatus sp.]
MAKISESVEIRWPRADDRLLRKAVDWSSAITFSNYSAERHALILNGYFQAGHALVDHCQRNTYERQVMIYPILFCYRHALEMAMKWIVSSYGRPFGVSPEPDHDLWQLWESCKAIFTQIDDEGAAVSTSTVERLVKEFHDLDIRAQAFRYSVTRKGDLLRLPDIAVDLINLRDVMQGLENFFSGADGYLDHLCSASNEMQYY